MDELTKQPQQVAPSGWNETRFAPLVFAAADLIRLVEGVGSVRWAFNGMRFKDTREWARFYVEAARVEKPLAAEPSPETKPSAKKYCHHCDCLVDPADIFSTESHTVCGGLVEAPSPDAACLSSLHLRSHPMTDPRDKLIEQMAEALKGIVDTSGPLTLNAPIPWCAEFGAINQDAGHGLAAYEAWKAGQSKMVIDPRLTAAAPCVPSGQFQEAVLVGPMILEPGSVKVGQTIRLNNSHAAGPLNSDAIYPHDIR